MTKTDDNPPSSPGCLLPDWPAPSRVRACCTTRAGGVSQGPFAGLNLATHVHDAPADVRTNRQRLSAQLGLPGEPLWLEQVHGTGIADADSDTPDLRSDAVTSAQPGRVCVVMTADCLPVLFCDRDGGCVGAAHAGWRGLHAGVLEATVAAMPAAAGDIIAWLGPAIGPDAFEVGPEVRTAFMRHDPAAGSAFRPGQADRWLADIYLLARQRLAAAGIGQVHGGGLCTYHDTERFYSYRRDGDTGRMASLIWLEY